MTPLQFAAAILAASMGFSALVGFVIGRISTAPKRKVAFFLSDEAIAHISHEALRAYQRSLGIIRLRTWNNLTPALRDALTRRVALRKKGGLGAPSGFASRIEQAVIDLSAGL
jgi:hypothetical protein